jgi:hypothetical protein
MDSYSYKFTAILIWVIFPFVLWCTEMKQEEEEENIERTNNIYDQEIHWKYLFQNVATTQRHTHPRLSNLVGIPSLSNIVLS